MAEPPIPPEGPPSFRPPPRRRPPDPISPLRGQNAPANPEPTLRDTVRAAVEEDERKQSGDSTSNTGSTSAPPAPKDTTGPVASTVSSGLPPQPVSVPVRPDPTLHPVEPGAPSILSHVVYIVTIKLLALPYFFVGADGVKANDVKDALVGYGIGFPIALIGLAEPWWRKKVKAVSLLKWAPLALTLAFVFFAGPNIYRRATAPRIETPSPAPQPDPRDATIGSLQSQLDTATRRLAELKQTQPSPPASQSPTPPHTELPEAKVMVTAQVAGRVTPPADRRAIGRACWSAR